MAGQQTLARRLQQRGARSLEDSELLALLSGRGQAPVRRLLARFADLGALFEATPPAVIELCGLLAWARLQAARELCQRQLEERLRRTPVLECPAATEQYLRASLGALEHELFVCLFLDNRHRLIGRETLFRGTVDGASVYPREVVKSALAHNAAALILAHNHPSGVAEPSVADEQITRRLKAALALVDIRIVDHLVIGRGDCVSFAARGLL